MSYATDLQAAADRVQDTVTISADLLESIAFNHPGTAIEMTADAAYLTYRGVTFRAELQAAS